MNKWLLIGLLGCNASGTSTVNLKNNDQGSNTNTDTSVDESDDENDEIDPLMGSNWNGERFFKIDGICEDTLTENGSDISDTDEGSELLNNQCPDCLQAFKLNVSPGSICNDEIGVSDPTYRTTLRIDETTAELQFYIKEGGFQLARVVPLNYENGQWAYNYSGTWGSFQYTISGYFEFND